MSYPNKTENITGIVLKTTEFKERDVIIQLATKKGIESLFVMGAQTAKSKNRRLTYPGTVIDAYITPQRQEKMSRLIHGDVLESNPDALNDLSEQAILFVLRDLVILADYHEDYFDLLKTLWSLAGKKDPLFLTVSLLLTARILQVSGIAPQLECCSVCGQTKGIEGLSLARGGFVCKEHILPDEKKLSANKLRSFRLLFRAGLEQLSALQQYAQFDLEDLIFLAGWFEHYTQSRLSSLEFLKNVSRID